MLHKFIIPLLNNVAEQPFILGQLYIKYFTIMPQLIPFYFLNQLSFAFLTLLALIYVFSKYILPVFTLQQVARMYIFKLSSKS